MDAEFYPWRPLDVDSDRVSVPLLLPPPLLLLGHLIHSDNGNKMHIKSYRHRILYTVIILTPLLFLFHSKRSHSVKGNNNRMNYQCRIRA